MRRLLGVLFWGTVILIGIPVFALLVKFSVGSFTATESSVQGESHATIDLQATAPSDLQPTGDLAEIFGLPSQYTDLQREIKEKEILGKVIEWRLPVFEVKRSSGTYVIQTGGEQVVGTFCHVQPQNEEDIRLLERVKTGDTITCKGVASGTFLRNIVINPAILVR